MTLFHKNIDLTPYRLYISHLMPGSWQMLLGESTRLWRRRCSPSYLCLWQAVCLAAVCPPPLATPVAISPLRLPHPSPLPPPSAAVHLQVTIAAPSTPSPVSSVVRHQLCCGMHALRCELEKQQGGVVSQEIILQPGGPCASHRDSKSLPCWMVHESESLPGLGVLCCSWHSALNIPWRRASKKRISSSLFPLCSYSKRQCQAALFR